MSLAVLLTTGAGYWSWVVQRTEGIYTGLSLERMRYAHLSEEQRLRMTCLGSHGRLDAARGHPRGFCVRFLKEAGLLPRATGWSHEPLETWAISNPD
jgi:hypothetical protein